MAKRKTLDIYFITYKGFDADYNLTFEGYTNMYTDPKEAHRIALYNNGIASEYKNKVMFSVEYKRVAKTEHLFESLENRKFSKRLAVRFSQKFY